MFATRLLTPSMRLHVGVGLSVSSILLGHQLVTPQRQRLLHCQAATPFQSRSSSFFEHNQPARDAQAQETTGQILNPVAFRQVSSGSFLGLLAGLAVGRVSRLLALIAVAVAVGVHPGLVQEAFSEVVKSLLMVGLLQYLESRGLRIIPYKKIQQVVGDVDAKSLVYENLAFKLAFGSTFTMAVLYI